MHLSAGRFDAASIRTYHFPHNVVSLLLAIKGPRDIKVLILETGI